MDTTYAKACPQDSPELLLAGLLKYISQNSLISFWYRIWDCPDDYPAPEVRRLMNEDEWHKIDQLNKMSLQKFVGIEHDHWIWLLAKCNLVKESKDGNIRFNTKAKWNEFLRVYDIDAEVEEAKCLRTKARRYIRLGCKTDNWHSNAPTQARKEVFQPPRCPNIGVIGRRLNKELQFRFEEEQNNEEDDWGDTGTNDTNVDISDDANSNECADECTDKSVAECADIGECADTGEAAKPCESADPFPLLNHYGLADLDLSNETDCNRFKRILGEMVVKQQQHTKEKNLVEYFQLRQNKSTTAVAVHSHKSDDAFESYHQKNPYLKNVVGCLDEDVKVGALRLSGYLAKHHKDQFIDTANASGVAVSGELNATESAALYTEAELVDEQWNTIMRHLRKKFDAKIACSLLDLKRKSYEGYTMPRVKVIYHRAGQKDEEKIRAEYQDIKAEFKKAVETLLRVYFGFLVEWRLTKLSDEEKRWKDRVDELNDLIPNQRKVVNDWKAGNDGKRRTALMALRRTRAPSNGVNGLNHAEVDELAALDVTFEAMTKARDTLIAERKSLNTKIDAKHEGRRRPSENVDTTWYLEMERIYRKHNVKREDYHKRKFQGRPLKEIMKKAEDIFTDAKVMLCEFKDDSVADIDAKIDKTCDEIIGLLRSWGEVFHVFYKKNPLPSAEEKDKFKSDMADAVAKHRALRAKVDDNNDTPKLHYAEDHGLEAIENHPDLCLCIEEWVEQFHQTERKKIEAKCKFEKDPIKHAQLAAKKRAGMNNPDIMAHCRKTKKPRGPYKKDD